MFRQGPEKKSSVAFYLEEGRIRMEPQTSQHRNAGGAGKGPRLLTCSESCFPLGPLQPGHPLTLRLHLVLGTSRSVHAHGSEAGEDDDKELLKL